MISRIFRWSVCSVMGLLLAGPVAAADEGEWISLIDKTSLNGWRTEGEADWKVEDGVLIGRQGENGTEGDLYTDQQWANFELEGEFKMKWPGNSGVWFRRSPSQPGYQMDILRQANYPNTFSGSLYAMGKGFIAENSDAGSVRNDDWNEFRIRVAGDHIAITLNGRTVIDTRDSRFPGPGSIGIQIHRGDQFTGMEIRLRDMRIREIPATAP